MFAKIAIVTVIKIVAVQMDAVGHFISFITLRKMAMSVKAAHHLAHHVMTKVLVKHASQGIMVLYVNKNVV